MKPHLAGMIALSLLLAACSAATLPGGTAAPTAASTVPATAFSATAGVGVAGPATVAAANGTPPPIPTAAPPTAIPPLPSGGSPTELKYLVLGHYPGLFYCDPDYYPVARADETERAREVFPQLQANQEEFQAILRHVGLSDLAAFSDAQKLEIYREHKRLGAILFRLAGSAYQFQLRIADNTGKGFAITGLIDANGTITELSRQPTFATCPICLAAGTQIATPGGPVVVEDLRVGDEVWTLDASGARIAGRLLETARVLAPAGHQLIHLALDDGRELWASPGHPTADGRRLGDLQPGDRLDGAWVVLAERVAYGQTATYDLLPAGGTGFYWANGILIASTLGG